jgi:hypothetical protein
MSLEVNKTVNMLFDNINLVESYDWVDKLLEERYKLYELTEKNIYNLINTNANSNNSSHKSSNLISNPFCNLEVEQKFNSLIHFTEKDNISEISSNTISSEVKDNYAVANDASDSDSNSLELEFMDGYDSDDYYYHMGRINQEVNMFCFY